MQFATGYLSHALYHSSGQVIYDFNCDGITDLLLFPSLFNQGSELPGKAFAISAGKVFDATSSVLPAFTTGFVKDWFVADLAGNGKTDLLLIDHGLELPQNAGGFQNGLSRLLVNVDDAELVLDASIGQLPRKFYHSGAVGDYLGTGKSQILLQNFADPAQPQPIFLLAQDTNGAYARQVLTIFDNYAYNPGAVATVHVGGPGRDLLALGTYVMPDGATGKKSISLWDLGGNSPTQVAAWDFPSKFDVPSQGAFKIITGDFRNTGHDDLIVLLESVDLSVNYTRSWVYLGYAPQGGLVDMTVQTLGGYEAPRVIDEFKVADVNNDGHADLVGFSFDPNIFGSSKQILLNDGDARFSWMNTAVISSDQGVFIPQLKQSSTGSLSDLQGFFKVTLTGAQSAAVDHIALPFELGTGPGYKNAGDHGAPGFNEAYYLGKHADAASAVATGAYLNGLDHYLQVGRALHYQAFAAGTRVVGTSGLDVVTYHNPWDEYFISNTGASVTVSAKGSTGTPDTLSGIERIDFGGAMFALDILGNGGQAYRLYQAAFGRVPDVGGLGFWIAQLDKGSSLEQVANNFILSREFQSLYGDHPTMAQFVEGLYQNVLHRPGDAAGTEFWVQHLNSANLSQAEVLMGFSESAENQAQLIGLIQNGFPYTPYP